MVGRGGESEYRNMSYVMSLEVAVCVCVCVCEDEKVFENYETGSLEYPS